MLRKEPTCIAEYIDLLNDLLLLRITISVGVVPLGTAVSIFVILIDALTTTVLVKSIARAFLDAEKITD